MLSDKLLSLLGALSKPERNRLRKFVHSPYLNDQDDVSRLFDVLDATLRKSPDKALSLDKPTIWKALYPSRTYDDAHLRRLMSDLTQLTQRFLVAEMRAQDPLGEALDLQRALERFDLPKHMAATERTIDHLIEEHPGKSVEYHYAQYRRHWNIFARASKQVATAGFSEKLIAADFHLECFYLAQKLKLYIDWLLFRGFRASEHELPVIPGFWDYLNDPRFDEAPLIRIFQKIITCFAEIENETHFEQLVRLLDHKDSQLARADLRECYFIAQNYCALKINQGNTPYYYRYFELIKNMVERDLLIENNQIPEAVFKNFITVSLGAGQYEWTERFIRQYADYLPARIRENARTFNLAYVYFYQKNYDRVIECLRDVEYSDVVYALGAKSILLRTYYEMEEHLALDSLIESFRVFLLRNKVISKNLKREYMNFISLVKKLSTLAPSDKKALERLRQRVSQTSYAMPKNWLMKKLAEIETGRRR
ncbi:MAG: hypothetical protein RMJ33_05725 [Saprospiraceae bacterium]|nr:hypothetical protein [Saprospiraceae bacterium]MDW8229319.1 hypothetical protein [Saprospiraceae bacterium]